MGEMSGSVQASIGARAGGVVSSRGPGCMTGTKGGDEVITTRAQGWVDKTRRGGLVLM